MAKCPVCHRESFTVEVRLIDKPPDKQVKLEESERKFEEKLMCESCYEELKYR